VETRLSCDSSSGQAQAREEQGLHRVEYQRETGRCQQQRADDRPGHRVHQDAASGQYRVVGLEIGADDYLSKPLPLQAATVIPEAA
jgi:hypothetical protein